MEGKDGGREVRERERVKEEGEGRKTERERERETGGGGGGKKSVKFQLCVMWSDAIVAIVSTLLHEQSGTSHQPRHRSVTLKSCLLETI